MGNKIIIGRSKSKKKSHTFKDLADWLLPGQCIYVFSL